MGYLRETCLLATTQSYFTQYQLENPPVNFFFFESKIICVRSREQFCLI